MVVICTAALVAGNITAAFGSASAPREVMAGSRPSSASPFSRWLSVRAHEAGLRRPCGLPQRKTCNATVTSGCGNIPPAVAVGSGPDGLAVDQATDTVYVANVGDNTVSVINGATCNATMTTGCGQNPPTIKVGVGPDGVAADQATDTIYVANGGDNTVSVINGATCNATVTSGCGQDPASVPMGGWPSNVTVNPATGTVYVPDNVDGQVSFFGNPAP